jgi:hypothetical protein
MRIRREYPRILRTVRRVLYAVRNAPHADANLPQAADAASRRCRREFAVPMVAG